MLAVRLFGYSYGRLWSPSLWTDSAWLIPRDRDCTWFQRAGANSPKYGLGNRLPIAGQVERKAGSLRHSSRGTWLMPVCVSGMRGSVRTMSPLPRAFPTDVSSPCSIEQVQ